jgi:uncharacterized alkaline shock family protein YloU
MLLSTAAPIVLFDQSTCMAAVSTVYYDLSDDHDGGSLRMDCKFQTALGTVTVNEEVLLKVAGYAALECYGIVGMAAKRTTDGIVQLMGRENLGRGVRIRAAADSVDVDLYIIVEYGISISAVATTIIETVKYKIEHLTGIKVNRVNVSIEDIRV